MPIPHHKTGDRLPNDSVVLVSKNVSCLYDVLLCELPPGALSDGPECVRYAVYYWFRLNAHGEGRASDEEFFWEQEFVEAAQSWAARNQPPPRRTLRSQTEAVRDTSWSAGDELPTGATVLVVSTVRPHLDILLCQLPSKHPNHYQVTFWDQHARRTAHVRSFAADELCSAAECFERWFELYEA